MKTNKLYNWLKLFISIVLLCLFAFVIIPLITTLPGIKQIVESKKRYNNEAESLFYTETKEFGEAGNFMNNSNKYPASINKNTK